MKNKTENKFFIAVDVGNSRASFALFNKTKILRRVDVIENKVNKKAISKILKDWNNLSNTSLKEAVVSDVNPDTTEKLKSILKTFGMKIINVRSIADKKIFKKYLSFKKLGEDRIANTYYLLKEINKPSAIIDVGTTINIDVFDGEYYKGGYIISGLFMELIAIQSIAKGTRTKNNISFNQNKTKPGNSTEMCLENGIVLSKVAFIEKAIKEIKKSLKKNDLAVILTGGGVKLLRFLKIFDKVELDATLKGIAALYVMKERK